jgi:hypothetical protein
VFISENCKEGPAQVAPLTVKLGAIFRGSHFGQKKFNSDFGLHFPMFGQGHSQTGPHSLVLHTKKKDINRGTSFTMSLTPVSNRTEMQD